MRINCTYPFLCVSYVLDIIYIPFAIGKKDWIKKIIGRPNNSGKKHEIISSKKIQKISRMKKATLQFQFPGLPQRAPRPQIPD